MEVYAESTERHKVVLVLDGTERENFREILRNPTLNDHPELKELAKEIYFVVFPPVIEE